MCEYTFERHANVHTTLAVRRMAFPGYGSFDDFEVIVILGKGNVEKRSVKSSRL
jgi:hypothetical protein